MLLMARLRAALPTVCPAWEPVAEAQEVCWEAWRTRIRKDMIQPANITLKIRGYLVNVTLEGDLLP